MSLPLSPTQRTQRLDSLTGLRWFAALAVFIYHSGQICKVPYIGDYTLYGDSGVAFFFVLSGFVLAWSFSDETTMRVFYWRRLVRIWPALVVSVAFAYVALHQVWSVARQDVFLAVSLLQAWHPNVLLTGNPVSWSLSAEAFFYLIFPFVIRPIIKSKPVVLAALAALLVGLDLGFRKWAFDYYLPHHNDTFHLLVVLRIPPYRVLEFLLGIVVAAAMLRGWRPRIPMSVALLLVAADVYAIKWAMEQQLLGMFWWNQLMTPAFAVLIISAAGRDLAGKRSVFRSRSLVALGTWSYAFYLIHLTVMKWLEPHVKMVPGQHWRNLVPLWTFLSVAVVLSWLCYHFIEHPADKWLRRIGPKNPRRPAAHAVGVPTPGPLSEPPIATPVAQGAAAGGQ
ncbi:acyltransferase [Kitasatospora terrestris]|uniref:Acyltransferase n=1 Tax=Kitasatospora terrestris TaxID=258051 RepID=A0ABP9EU94_9ACTN